MQESGIFDGFYRRRRTIGWQNRHSLLLSATGAIAFGMAILAGGLFLTA
jgi:hypothetical protein